MYSMSRYVLCTCTTASLDLKGGHLEAVPPCTTPHGSDVYKRTMLPPYFVKVEEKNETTVSSSRPIPKSTQWTGSSVGPK